MLTDAPVLSLLGGEDNGERDPLSASHSGEELALWVPILLVLPSLLTVGKGTNLAPTPEKSSITRHYILICGISAYASVGLFPEK